MSYKEASARSNKIDGGSKKESGAEPSLSIKKNTNAVNEEQPPTTWLRSTSAPKVLAAMMLRMD
jgi:hypothetical protein